jgi:valyl-tRNA synthetase
MDFTVPMIYDESVAKDKGTGLMMVCTFGDKEDIEKWYKFKLELRSIFTKYGKLNESAGKYVGLSIVDARKKIIEDLKESGHLKNQKEIVHNVNVYERDGQPIEFMVTPQWFVDVLDKKEELVELGNNIKWHPKHMQTRYTNWVEGLGWDWCISRQRHFGVPFPVWYEKDTNNIIVAKPEDLPIDPEKEVPSWYEKDKENLIPETDVMDTWATSSVSPQIALDRCDDEEIKETYPMTLRMQAHDIIRTWAFYTMTKSLYATDKQPWENIMVSGFVLDSKGKKMSKSKGNVVDPTALVEKYGADAVRYGASAVKLGEDIPFMEKYLDTGKKLATKMFNASKFVHMHLEDYTTHEFDENLLMPEDKLYLQKLNARIIEATKHLEEYEFAKARFAIEQFFWDFCDNYVEIVKDRLYKPDVYGEASRKAAQMACYEMLHTQLRLFAPYLPFVTEEVYSWYFAKDETESVHTQKWPVPVALDVDDNVALDRGLLIPIIAAGRQEKNKAGCSQKQPITSLVVCTKDKAALEPFIPAIKATLTVEEFSFSDEPQALEIHDAASVTITVAPKEEKTPE